MKRNRVVVFTASKRVYFLLKIEAIFRDNPFEYPNSLLEHFNFRNCLPEVLIGFRFNLALFEVGLDDASAHHHRDNQKNARLNKKYNAAVDEMERLAAQFNVEVQAYRAKDSS